MIKMPIVHDIRERYQNGDSITQIARDLRIDRKTVRKYVKQEDFSPKAPVKQKRKTIIDPYEATIREYLEEDKKHWRKQHHTAQRIYERLRDEHEFEGSYETVQKAVKRIRTSMRRENKSSGKNDAYLQLEWPAGSAQVDFGEVEVQRDGELCRMHALMISFPYSNIGYSQVFDGETAECVCQGLRDIFEHIGGVPKTIVFDNATGIGRRIMGKVHMTGLFERFETHYGFKSRFCNPYSGNEKGSVERKVFTLRSHLFVPVPEIKDICRFNAELLERSYAISDKEHYRKEVNQHDLFREDLKALLELPPHGFEACRFLERKANKYGHIQLDGNHFYSTEPELKGANLIVELGAHTVRIMDQDGTIVAEHRRQFGKNRTESIDPASTLAALSRRPGAWEQCAARDAVSEPLQKYIDETNGAARREALRTLSDLSSEFGFSAAVEAFTKAVEDGSPDHDSVMLLAAWMNEEKAFGPLADTGPSLAEYDVFLLPQGGNPS